MRWLVVECDKIKTAETSETAITMLYCMNTSHFFYCSNTPLLFKTDKRDENKLVSA